MKRRTNMKSSRFILSSFIVAFCLLFAACGSKLSKNIVVDNQKEASFPAEAVIGNEYYDLDPQVYAVRDGKRSSTSLNTIIYPRNFGVKEDTDTNINYHTIDWDSKPNLIYDGECQKLCLTLTRMPKSIDITQIEDDGQEKKVDYIKGKEASNEGSIYTFSFDFSYEVGTSVIYSIKVTYPEDRVLDMAFKVRNGTDKPLKEDAIAINLELEEADKSTLYKFLLNCSYTKTIHTHYIMGENIHIEKKDKQEVTGATVFSIMANDGVLSYGYLWKGIPGLFFGEALGSPQAFDVDQDEKNELVVITKWVSSSILNTIYVFDEDEKQVGIVSYRSLELQLPEKQNGEYYKILYMNDAPANSGITSTSIGTLHYEADANGIRKYYIKAAEDDSYTDIESCLAQNSN
jgi:hypothetical protein